MKIIKFVFVTLMTLALLLALGFAALFFWVNPNNFKPAISREVYKMTGRELTINGNIRWSLLPTPGLQIDNVQLSNAPPFTNEPFAEIGEMAVSIKLAPLLHGKIETNTLTVNHLLLNLKKNAQGITNWQDLLPSRPAHASAAVFTVTAETPPNLPAPDSAPLLPVSAANSLKVQINNVTIKDSIIRWENQQTHQQATLSITNLETSAVNINNEPFKISGRFALDALNSSASQKMSGQFSLNALLKINADTQHIRVDDLDLQGKIIEGNNEMALQIKTQGELNGANQSVNLNPLALTVNQMNIKAEVTGQRLLSLPEFQGNAIISPFDLNALLQSLKIQVNINNPKALQNAYGQFSFAGTRNSFMINNFQGGLGDTKISGSLGLSDIANHVAKANLSVTQLTLDHYLTASPVVQAKMQRSWSAGLVNSAFALPVTSNQSSGLLNWLRQLTLQGQITVDQLTFGKLRASQVKTLINQQNGLVVLNPISANFYGGNFAGNVRADIHNDPFAYSTEQSLSQINTAALVKQLTGTDVISGTGQVTSKLTANGDDLNTFTRTLNGQVDIQIANGTLVGISFINQLETAYAMFKNIAIPNFKGGDNTDFMTFSAHVDIQNGIAVNKDLTITASGLNAKGSGQIDLVNQTIDYRLEITIEGGQWPQVSQLAELGGGTIPIIISGRLDHPKATPDYPTLLKRVAEKRLGKNLTNVQDKIDQIGGNLGKKLRSILGN